MKTTVRAQYAKPVCVSFMSEPPRPMRSLKAMWTPTQADIQWQANLLRILKPNAIWATDEDGVFQIDQKRKTVRLVEGNPDNEYTRRIIKVFGCLGYTFEKAEKHPWEK